MPEVRTSGSACPDLKLALVLSCDGKEVVGLSLLGVSNAFEYATRLCGQIKELYCIGLRD